MGGREYRRCTLCGMNDPIDLILRPGTLVLLAIAGLVVGGILFDSYYWFDKRGTDGLILGVFIFASACLLGAVLRVGQGRSRG